MLVGRKTQRTKKVAERGKFSWKRMEDPIICSHTLFLPKRKEDYWWSVLWQNSLIRHWCLHYFAASWRGLLLLAEFTMCKPRLMNEFLVDEHPDMPHFYSRCWVSGRAYFMQEPHTSPPYQHLQEQRNTKPKRYHLPLRHKFRLSMFP